MSHMHMQEQPAVPADAGEEDGQKRSKQAQAKQPKQRQRRLFLESVSEDESEPIKAPVTERHAPTVGKASAKQQRAAASSRGSKDS